MDAEELRRQIDEATRACQPGEGIELVSQGMTLGILKCKLEHLKGVMADPRRLMLTTPMERTNAQRFIQEVENSFYPPGTHMNDSYRLCQFNWNGVWMQLAMFLVKDLKRIEAKAEKYHFRLRGLPAIAETPIGPSLISWSHGQPFDDRLKQEIRTRLTSVTGLPVSSVTFFPIQSDRVRAIEIAPEHATESIKLADREEINEEIRDVIRRQEEYKQSKHNN